MKRVVKWLSGISIFLLIILLLVIWFSPYGKHDGFSYKLVKSSVHVSVSADSVFRYLGNSENAKRWSVFVDHITPFDTSLIADGFIGSKRRCFCQPDEKGIYWDETVEEVIPNLKRKLSCYNLHGFSMSTTDIATEQLYVANPDGSCDLTFTFFIDAREPGFIESLKLYFGAYRISSIFQRNLENMKSDYENHQRIHQKE